MSYLERRKARRLVALALKENIVHVDDGDASYETRLLNFSELGALLRLRDSDLATAAAGKRCSLFFQRGGHFFKLNASIVRTGADFAAFEFVDLTPSDKEEIKRKLILLEILENRVAIC